MKDIFCLILCIIMWFGFLATSGILCLKFNSLKPLFILLIPLFMNIEIDNKERNPIKLKTNFKEEDDK